MIPASTSNPMTIGLTASNIPLGTAVTVTVKPLNGAASSATSTTLAGTLAASTATATVTIPTNQPSVISASATFTLAALPGAGPLVAQGEEVEWLQVAATLGGASQVTYITKSGREVPAAAARDPIDPGGASRRAVHQSGLANPIGLFGRVRAVDLNGEGGVWERKLIVLIDVHGTTLAIIPLLNLCRFPLSKGVNAWIPSL